MKKSFLVFFLFAAVFLIGIGFWISSRNAYSKETLKIDILGSDQAASGDEVTYTVRYKNNGTMRLEHPTLVFQYPAGAIPSDGASLRTTKDVEDVYPGQEESVQFKGRLFGREGDLKEAKALIRYSPKNLNATYQSDSSLITKISSVPLNLDIDIPSKMESGQRFTFDVNYFSHSDYPLSDLLIRVAYPDGFSFVSAIPAPPVTNDWTIGNLEKTGGGRISITGVLQGQTHEQKTFKATLGTWKDGAFTPLAEASKDVEISTPNIEISQLVNGLEAATASAGDSLRYDITFKNVSDKNLQNLSLRVVISGKMLNMDSLRADSGTFQKENSFILWTANDHKGLAFLDRGEEGHVGFSVSLKSAPDFSSPLDKNLVVKDTVSLSDIQKEYTVRVNSDLRLQTLGSYADEVFGNEGPLPPVVGQKTTYTMVWKASNTTNDVANVRARAKLPRGIELTGKIFPSDSKLTFDSQSREIVWEIGDLKVGAGRFTAPSSVAFQIALVPRAEQQGAPAPLMGQVRISGEDQFTRQLISAVFPALDSASLGDSAISQTGGIVH